MDTLAYLLNKFARKVTHMWRKAVVDLEDPLIRGSVAFVQILKRWRPRQQFIAQYAQRPHVNPLVVRLALNHLGRKVVQRPAKRSAPTMATSYRNVSHRSVPASVS